MALHGVSGRRRYGVDREVDRALHHARAVFEPGFRHRAAGISQWATSSRRDPVAAVRGGSPGSGVDLDRAIWVWRGWAVVARAAGSNEVDRRTRESSPQSYPRKQRITIISGNSAIS